MKSILVPVEPHEQMDCVLDHALLLARKRNAYIEGFALRRMVPLAAVDPLAASFVVTSEADDETMADEARRAFHEFMASCSVARAGRLGEAPSYGWLEGAPAGEAFLGSYARAFDITVVGRPDPHGSPRMSTLESALFESGRPVLVVPPRAPDRLGSRVVIAWNGSTETARAISFAMPLLESAEDVVVLTVEGGSVPDGPSGVWIVRSLERHGIVTRALHVTPERRSSVGEAILSTASALARDLLIKGAYTQSRLRQMIFGGPTRHVLWSATLPVLVAH